MADEFLPYALPEIGDEEVAEVIDALVSSGVVVAAGHSDATAEELVRQGLGEKVRAYLGRIAAGGFA